MKIAEGITSNSDRGILVSVIGRERPAYRRPSIEEEIARVRARAARRGGGLSHGPSGRAARDAELEKLQRRYLELDDKIALAEGRPVQRRGLPPGRKYADGLRGSWPSFMFSPQRQREHERLVASVRGTRGGEYR